MDLLYRQKGMIRRDTLELGKVSGDVLKTNEDGLGIRQDESDIEPLRSLLSKQPKPVNKLKQGVWRQR